MLLTCIIIEDEKMSMGILTSMVTSHSNLNLVASFENPLKAVSFLSTAKVDLIFLDIEMPELNGFEVLESLNYQPKVILTTAKKNHAFEGFEHNVNSFLLKPFTLPKFSKAVGKLLSEFGQKQFSESSYTNSIFVKKDGVYENVVFDKILYIEALGDFVKIHTENGRVVTRTTMKEIEYGLNQELFMRIHRSFIVNLKKLNGIEDNAVIINKAVLPIGKIYRSEFFERINLL